MLSTHKKLLLKSALTLVVATPVFLATVMSCTPSQQEESDKVDGSQGGAGNQPNNPPTSQPKPPAETPTPQPPVTEPDDSVELPTFLQKELNQAQSLVINNKTWSRITNFNAKRNLEKDVYLTSITKKYHESFKYPAWNYNWEKRSEGDYGWFDRLTDWEYEGREGEPVVVRAINGADLIWNERTDFQVGTDQKTGKPIFAKYNDPRFILNEIKNGTLKQHPAAGVWFEQQISDQTKAITKQFSVPGMATGSTATGLYAGPGEVITLKFSESTLDKMISQNVKNFQVVINENYWDNKDAGNPKQSGTVSNRYPFVQTFFSINPEEVKANGGIFKFGSPFGGAITIRVNSKMVKPSGSIFSQSYENYDFEISGALEMLSYIDGVTTKADWDAQIERVKNGQISTPAMSIDLPLLAMNIPSTGINKFAGVAYDQIVFPEDIAKKWNSFMFLTEFIASRDKTNNFTKLMLRFCDDIWDGAGAWAGNNSFAAPIGWSANSFLRGLDGWNLFGNNWGVFHEVNHNFEQNGALFSKQSHGTTNQSTMYIMTMLSDNGKYRNLYNPLGQLGGAPTNSWNVRMSSAFNTFNFINAQLQNNKKGSEYELPTILAFQLGSFNMMQYIRNDAYNGANSKGMREVIQLSNAFKMNLWPAIKQFSEFWDWSDWTIGPNESEKAELDEIAKKYQAVNFVANIFATGAYIYDQEKDRFLYTNDTSAPLIAATNAPYVLDFEKGINSFKNSLEWDQLTFSKTTKLGGQLIQDQTKPKRLIYLPPQDVYNQMDEFDVGILPTNQGDNFVKEYRWKIKMNLVSNLPVVTMYNNATTTFTGQKGKDFYQEQAYMDEKANYAFQAPIDVRKGIYSDHNLGDKTWQKAKVSFKFVAPETGDYEFKIKGDSWFFIDIDKEHKQNPDDGLWWKADKVPSNDFINTPRLNLSKGESVRFDVYLSQLKAKNTLQMQAIVNQNIYDLFDHVTSPFANASEELLGFIYDPRLVDQNLINHNLTGGIQGVFNNIISKDQYEFILPNGDKSVDKKLAEADKHNWEEWGQSNQPITRELIVKFKEAQTIGSIAFNHGNPNWSGAKPTEIVIKDQDENILYEGQFGKQFNDRNLTTPIINIKPTKVSQLSIKMTNTKIVSKGQSALSFNSIQFSPENWHYLNRTIAATNPAIKYFGPSWELKANNADTNISAFSTHYATTNKQYEYFETTVNATGFDLVGQKNPELGAFDLYVNDQLIGTYNTNQPISANNQILASYRVDDWATSQTLKIKIVNRDDKPLRLDGLQLYGRQVHID